ncbi:MAG: hypothetical protein Q9P90_04940 [candidate division KSB1 bacterium]|nr:hypothetical protein [candidate division KSB1 bacterium]
MIKEQRKKLIQEGQFMAEVEVDILYTDEAWSPYLSLKDAMKLDEVRVALRNGDLKKATKLARVYRLEPIEA